LRSARSYRNDGLAARFGEHRSPISSALLRLRSPRPPRKPNASMAHVDDSIGPIEALLPAL
jgi:hypothetical protein